MRARRVRRAHRSRRPARCRARCVRHHAADAITKDVSHVDVVTSADASPSACTVTQEDPSFGATESIDSCSEAQNGSTVQTGCGTGSVAWEYIPAHDIDVTRLELDVAGGGVALYDSQNGAPGAKLFEGTFDTGAQTWRGVAVSPPIHLAACHLYFIEQVAAPNGFNPCSTAENGVAQRQFNAPNWEGPFIWLAWAAHVIGTCP